MPKEKGALKADPVPPAESDDKPTEVSESSTETEQGDKPATLLDAVRNAVPTPEEIAEEVPPASETESDPDAGTETKTDEVTAETQTDEVKDDEPAEDPRLDKHPRFQRVLAERDEARVQVAALTKLQTQHNLSTEQIAQLATNQVALDGYMVQHNLIPDDLDRAIGFATQIKNDPVAGLKMLREYADQLENDLGLKLSGELAEKVESGYLDEETALELQQRRVQEKLNRDRQEQVTKQQAQQQAQQQEAARISGLRAAAEAWENAKITRDPDYQMKRTLIYDRARTLIAAAPAIDQAGVNEIMDRAHREVTEHLHKMQKPKPVTTQTSNGTATSGAKAQPKTLAEAVRNA